MRQLRLEEPRGNGSVSRSNLDLVYPLVTSVVKDRREGGIKVPKEMRADLAFPPSPIYNIATRISFPSVLAYYRTFVNEK